MRDPIEDLQTLRTEIKLYDEDLSKFEWVIVANKMDLEGAEENLANFRARFPEADDYPDFCGYRRGSRCIARRARQACRVSEGSKLVSGLHPVAEWGAGQC